MSRDTGQTTTGETPSILETERLRVRVAASEAQLKERQDELFFANLRLKEKSTRLRDLEDEICRERSTSAKATKQLEELHKTCQAQYCQNLELQYHLRNNSLKEIHRVPVSGKFHKQKDLAVQLLRKEKRLKSINTKAARHISLLEERVMSLEDPLNSAQGSLAECIRQRDDVVLEAAKLRRSNSLPPSASQELRSAASWDLPMHKTVVTTTEDTYIECKVSKSIFEAQLRQLRNDITPLLQDYKDSADKGVTQLWPRDDFFKETSSLLTKSKVFVADMLRRINCIIKDFLREEKCIKDKWRQQTRPDCDAQCEVDMAPAPDPLLDELRGEVQTIRTRLREVRETTAVREKETQRARDEAESSLKFLQGKVSSLHQHLYTALHQVYKHRFKWISRLPNPLRPPMSDTRTATDHLGEVIDKDIEYTKKFADYFTSDEMFGVDMTSRWDERDRVKADHKERAPSRLRSRVRSGSATSLPEGRVKESGLSREAEADVGADLSRMQSWRAKQQKLWELKKKTQVQQRDALYVPSADRTGADDVHIVLQGTSRLSQTVPDQLKPVPRVSVTVLPGQSGASKSQVAGSLPSDCVPGLSKSSSDLFQRVILKRRNLPLRPASEPSLAEGSYRLEGSKVVQRCNSQGLL